MVHKEKIIEKLTEKEAKHLLKNIADIFSIGSAACTPGTILVNVKNAANDEFCRYKKVMEFLEGKTFSVVLMANGHTFLRPGHKPDFWGKTILEAVEKAMDYE